MRVALILFWFFRSCEKVFCLYWPENIMFWQAIIPAWLNFRNKKTLQAFLLTVFQIYLLVLALSFLPYLRFGFCTFFKDSNLTASRSLNSISFIIYFMCDIDYMHLLHLQSHRKYYYHKVIMGSNIYEGCSNPFHWEISREKIYAIQNISSEEYEHIRQTSNWKSHYEKIYICFELNKAVLYMICRYSMH